MGPPTDGGRTRVPTLEERDPVTKRVIRQAVTNEEKSKMFFKAFFPGKPPTQPALQDEEYPPPKWTFEPVSDEQIHRAIRKMKPYKATRSGTIPNSVFTHAREVLVPHLGPLYRATDTLAVYPDAWKHTETPVLRKPGKADYTVPGAYRPIALSDGFARVLNMCKTEDAVLMAESKGLLPPNHFGG
ncbi:hypothetical protein GALMADRAFT_75901, partial [Galerina marginata CBS 339.88]